MSAIIKRLREIFVGVEGTYLNEYGEEVYGKLPRQKPESPITVMRRPTLMNYLCFVVGLLAWSMDGYDFQCISLSVSKLALYYHQKRDAIATSITVTLLFRPLGAIIFGLAGDLYGRKWPMIFNMLWLLAIELGTAHAPNFTTFLICRSLFGIAMGGIWGNAVSMGLENMPTESRGFFSGILQQGYSIGFLLAAAFNLTVIPKSYLGFKALFYIGAGLTSSVTVMRLFFPESKQFLERRQKAKENPELAVTGKKKVAAFLKDTRAILKQYWKRCIYACILMTLFSCVSHASQDMYPTYIQQTKGFTADQASKATIVGMVGAVVGGTVVGYYSQYVGRRAAIIVTALVGACMIPLWILPNSFVVLCVGAFLIQFCVQGAWGVIPVHLNELSPPQFRSSFPGISYQIGNMIASPMAQISSIISEHLRIYVKDKKTGQVQSRPDYSTTQAVMMTIIFLLVAFWTACGDEAKGTHFELAEAAGEATTEGKAHHFENGGESPPIETKEGSEVIRMEERTHT